MQKGYIMEQLNEFAAKHGVNFESELLNELVSISTFQVVPKGKMLQSIGEKTDVSGIVLSGITRSYYLDNDGNDITKGFAVEGTFCMDAGMLGFTENICMCETLEETTIMFFETQKIKCLIDGSDSLKSVWMKLLENALRHKMYRESTFLLENATERYLHFRERYPDLAGRVAQQYIATYLGITPESLSRIRKALREETE